MTSRETYEIPKLTFKGIDPMATSLVRIIQFTGIKLTRQTECRKGTRQTRRKNKVDSIKKRRLQETRKHENKQMRNTPHL
jgi:predicted RNA-binding protein